MSYLLKDSPNTRTYKIIQLRRELNVVNDLISLFKIIKIISSEKPDIVHSHMAKAGALARIAVIINNIFKRKKIKVVHTYHGHVLEGYFSELKSKLFTLIEKILAINTDAIIAISNTQKWELTEKYKISASENIQIINLGFNLSSFKNGHGTKGDLRRKIGVGDNETLVGIVGRLVPIKNHRMFIDAAKVLLNEKGESSLRFVVVGDGELRTSLEQYVKARGLKDKISFIGWEKDIKKVYSDLDLLVLTSINEGTPVSIIEAMASSIPVVTTGVGGVKDLLGGFAFSENKSRGFNICERGILIQTNDAIALSDGIKYILSSPTEQKSRQILKARDYVLANYTDTKLIQNIEKLYSKLVDQ